MNFKHFKNQLKKNKLLYYILLIPYFPIKTYNKIKIKKKNKIIIKDSYKTLSELKKDKSNIFYFGVPIHFNLGDMAQTYCTRKFISENYPLSKIFEFNTPALLDNTFIKDLKKVFYQKNLIFIQSGYCSHDLHLDHKMHKIIVKNFQNNRIIILPQTVNLSSKKEIEETSKIYNSHSNLLFITRDKISYNMAKKYFNKTKIDLYPDIVTTLIGTRERVDNRNNILLCMRNDSEKKYSSKQIEDLKKKLLKFTDNVDITDTNLTNVDIKDFSKNFADYLEQTLSLYEKYKVIITDRYHGTIFSVIANTPVIVLATNDHKVKSGVDWFTENGYNSVFYASDVNNACKIAYDIYNSDIIYKNKDYFNSVIYKKLKTTIDNI